MTHSANFRNRHKRFDPSSLSDIAALTRCGHAQRRHAIFGAVAQAWVALRRLAASMYQHLTRRLRRAELDHYDDRLLRDMGITRYDLQTPRRGVHETITTWFRRTRERKQLARMTERELHDIRISRPDADMEIQKPFWRP